MTIKHKDVMSISSSSSGSTSKPPRPTLSSEVGSSISSHSKLTPQQIEELRRYESIERVHQNCKINIPFLIRSKRYQQQPPLPLKNINPPPPIPAKNLPQPPQQQQLQQQQQQIQVQTQPSTAAVAIAAVPEHTTTVVCSFCDEDVPYRIKIPGKSPLTLRQFKESLPKKGNYR
jgi:hypothetical protein